MRFSENVASKQSCEALQRVASIGIQPLQTSRDVSSVTQLSSAQLLYAPDIHVRA